MEKNKKNIPKIIIFGRTNVGKSTLFNTLTETNRALTSKIQCTTRDSNIGEVHWQGKSFKLVDTGGIVDEDAEKILNAKKLPKKTVEEKVQKQALEYIKKADLILFLVDAKTGLLPQDSQMAHYLKKRDKKNILLIANKADTPKYRNDIAEFNKLSLGEPIPISATTGSGTGDLLDLIIKKLKIKKSKNDEEEEENISVCIIGKPNVGKSSLLNSLMGEERVIVSETAHTTREPQDTNINYKEKKITLIDTAGISKRGKKTKGLEKFGIEKSLIALKKADIAILVIDISEPITHQDSRLIEEITEKNKSLIIVANKWDQIEEKEQKEHTKAIYHKFPFVVWAPIQFTSALTGKGTNKIFELILKADAGRKKELSQSQLDKLLSRIVKIHPPAKAKGIKPPYIYKINQLKTNPPLFSVKIGPKDTLHFSYINFIKNQLRDKFEFFASPINIKIKTD